MSSHPMHSVETNFGSRRSAAVRMRAGGPTSRRLAFETMESRLVLSGTQLDLGTWNLDSIQDNYAVIPEADVAMPTLQNSVAPFASIDVNGWIDSTIDQDGALFGQGWFRDVLQDERHVAIDVFQNAEWPPLFDGSLAAGPGLDRPVKHGIEADAESGLFSQPYPRWPAGGPYASMLGEDVSEADLFADGADATPLAAQAVGSPVATREANQTGWGPSEGGEISLGRLLAEAAHVSPRSRPHSTESVANATPGATHDAAAPYVAGELVRAVAFETIDGAAATVVGPTAKGIELRPTAAVAVADETVARAPSDAAVDANWPNLVPVSPALRDEQAIDERAVLEPRTPPSIAANESAPVPSDAVVAQAFAEWADRVEEGERDRLDREEHPHLWVAGMPILAALIAERLVAARRNAREADSRDPRRTKRSATI